MVTALDRLRSDGPLSFLSDLPPPNVTSLPCDTDHIISCHSVGSACSRSSYSRAIGRIVWSAIMWIIWRAFSMDGDISKSIIDHLLVRNSARPVHVLVRVHVGYEKRVRVRVRVRVRTEAN